MRTSTTVSIRIDVCDLATLLRELLDAAILSKTAGHGAYNNFCANKAIGYAVRACCDSVPESKQFHDHRQAWEWLVENGVITGQQAAKQASVKAVFKPDLLKKLERTPLVSVEQKRTALDDLVGRLDGRVPKDVKSLDAGPTPERTNESE